MEPFRMTGPIRLIEFFAGVGSQAMALRDLGVPFETWATSEWEVNANASYKAIHMPDDDTDYSAGYSKEALVQYLHGMGISNDGKDPMALETIQKKNEAWLRQTFNNIESTKNLVNIMKINAWDLKIEDTDKFTYLLTYSFPCQDLSVAGKQAGMSKGSGTRSGLLWEVERILTECFLIGGQAGLPQVLLMENVPQVHGKKNMDDFQKWLNFLESLGYHSTWADLNAKDFGVAQSRNRCFCVSLLGDYSYEFPTPFELTKTMEDYLEDEVPDEFYVTSDKAHELIDKLVVDQKIPLPEGEEDEMLMKENPRFLSEEARKFLFGDQCPTQQ